MREKLIELIDEAEEHSTDICVFHDSCEDCPGIKYGNKCRDYLKADHLIANGVTISNLETVDKEWIPVTERLPENDQKVLCFNYNGEYKVLRWNYIDWMWNSGIEWLKEDYVLYWMPLPEPPKGD